MESSLMCHAFGIGRDYQYHATAYKDNPIVFKLKSISEEK